MRYTHSFPVTQRHIDKGYETSDNQACGGSCDKCEGEDQPDEALVKNTADTATFIFKFDRGHPVRAGTVIIEFDTDNPAWSRLNYVPAPPTEPTSG